MRCAERTDDGLAMAKPSESARWAPGKPRPCFSSIGIRKKEYATAAEAASHCLGSRRYIYRCPEGQHWHIASYKGGK